MILFIENNQLLLKKNEELNKKLNTKIQEAEGIEFKAKQFETKAKNNFKQYYQS